MFSQPLFNVRSNPENRSRNPCLRASASQLIKPRAWISPEGKPKTLPVNLCPSRAKRAKHRDVANHTKWSRFGLYLVSTWSLLGLYFVAVIDSGLYLVSTWSLLGLYLVSTCSQIWAWSLLGLYLVSTWSLLGLYLVSNMGVVSTWSRLGLGLVSTWSLLGLYLVSTRSICGLKNAMGQYAVTKSTWMVRTLALALSIWLYTTARPTINRAIKFKSNEHSRQHHSHCTNSPMFKVHLNTQT
jgi:hypothetical protein